MLLANIATAHEYTVEGKLTHTDYAPNGDSVTYHERFKIQVSGRQWIIWEERDSVGKPFQIENSFDGTNSFRLMKYPPQNKAAGKQSGPTLQGFITSSELPAPSPLLDTTLIWLAYASAPHFLQSEPEKARPVWWLDEEHLWRTGFKVSAKWNLRPLPPFLPEQITYYDDGMTHPLDGSEPFSHSPGYTNVYYSATFTNIGELSLPLRFSMLRLRMANDAPGPWLSAIDEAEALKITPSCVLRSFRPELLGLADISDCRVEPDPRYAVRYTSTNGNWKVMSPSNLVAYQTQVKAEADTPPIQRSSAKSWVTLFVMALVSGGFIALLLKTARDDVVEQPSIGVLRSETVPQTNHPE